MHGGKREGSGRTPLPEDQKKIAKTIYITPTQHDDIEKYAQDCGIKTEEQAIVSGYRVNVETKSYKALLSRFFICEIVTDENTGVSRLACHSVSTRGTEEEQKKRLQMFIDFQEKFNEFIKDYQPQNIDVDYSSVLE